MRPDLLALTTEALVRFANVGLVKRAQKELAAGNAPALSEEPDGTVVAAAKDGATTRLPRGVALPQAPCTCGSQQVCRHRLAAVLAYQQLHAAPTANVAWDPGALDETGLDTKKADALIAKGIVVTVRPGAPPTAALPMATVQFLVPNDLAYAKCDCAKGHGCEHVVIAVRAFRANPAGGAVTLHTGAAAQADEPTHALVLDALAHLAQYGLAAPGSDAKLHHARGAAERAGWWWIVDGLEAVERLAEAYHRQSARFQLDALARETGELVARLRAATAEDAPLAPAYVLGGDRAGETAMEQVRLLALGARLDADDDRRIVRLYFADPDTATVLVLEKTWPTEARVGAELGQLFASSRMSIADLARGELVTRAARRRPNGALDLGAARGMKSSLLPSSGSWGLLPEPLLVRDLAAYAAQRRDLPPVCLCPRGLGTNVAVVAIARVIEVDAAPDGQSVTGAIEDLAGNRLVVHTEHRQVSPGAVDATHAALRSAPTHVAGELRRVGERWRIDPLAFLGKQLVVVDLQKPARRTGVPATSTVAAPADEPAAAIRDYVGRTLLRGNRATQAIATKLARDLDTGFARRLAALATRAGAGSPTAVLDLAMLQQLVQ